MIIGDKQRGFTLIEVVVTLSVVAILAAIMIPMISSNIKSARYAKARSDVNTIKDAIVKFRTDLGKWPVYDNANVYHNLLYGDGSRDATWDTANPKLSLAFSLVQMPTIYNPGPSVDGTPAWNGPYLGELKEDPWGYAYLVNSGSFLNSSARVWVISGGEDRVIAAPFNGSSDPPSTADDVFEYLQ